MDRIKGRIAVFLAVAGASGVLVVASPARASECHPMPEQYCNTMNWLRDCVFRRPPADWCDA